MCVGASFFLCIFFLSFPFFSVFFLSKQIFSHKSTIAQLLCVCVLKREEKKTINLQAMRCFREIDEVANGITQIFAKIKNEPNAFRLMGSGGGVSDRARVNRFRKLCECKTSIFHLRVFQSNFLIGKLIGWPSFFFALYSFFFFWSLSCCGTRGVSSNYSTEVKREKKNHTKFKWVPTRWKKNTPLHASFR